MEFSFELEDDILSLEAFGIQKRIDELDLLINHIKPYYLKLREERAKLESRKVHNKIKESTLSTLGMGY